jgi:uncharacterized protein YcbK (DUF882 family)|tara:strand:+ start:4593 stop:4904 length:312 start_codon:yes stop_codon:yes gene_type:complete
MIRKKEGVLVNGLKPEILFGLQIAEGYFESMGISEVVVTSVVDGVHSQGSLHYVGYAADLRIWAIEDNELDEFARGLSEELGVEFDVVLETDHIHMEFQPKRR